MKLLLFLTAIDRVWIYYSQNIVDCGHGVVNCLASTGSLKRGIVEGVTVYTRSIFQLHRIHDTGLVLIASMHREY